MGTSLEEMLTYHPCRLEHACIESVWQVVVCYTFFVMIPKGKHPISCMGTVTPCTWFRKTMGRI